jgi:hypothetical protein
MFLLISQSMGSPLIKVSSQPSGSNSLFFEIMDTNLKVKQDELERFLIKRWKKSI